MKKDTINVKVRMDGTEMAQLRDLNSRKETKQALDAAKGFFSHNIGENSPQVVINLVLADCDKTDFVATLRKIEKPPLLNKGTSGAAKEANFFMELLIGRAVSILRNSQCEHYGKCVNFVAEKCNLNRVAHRHSRRTCLGFSCTGCQYFKKPEQEPAPNRDIAYAASQNFRQPSAWDVSLRTFIMKI